MMLGTSIPSASKERKPLIRMRKAKCYGRWLTCRKQKPGLGLGASCTWGPRKVCEAVGEFGLQYLSCFLSHSQRDLVAHVYPMEQWFSKTLRQQKHQRPLQSARNAHFGAHCRPVKSETLGVAQKPVSQALQEFLMQSPICEPPP